MSAQQSTPDPAEAARVFAEVAERSGKLLADFAQRNAGKGIAFTDEFGIAKAFMDLSAAMFTNPWKAAEVQMKMMWDYAALWQSSMLKLMGQPVQPVVEPAKGDNRFRDTDW